MVRETRANVLKIRVSTVVLVNPRQGTLQAISRKKVAVLYSKIMATGKLHNMAARADFMLSVLLSIFQSDQGENTDSIDWIDSPSEPLSHFISGN